MGYAALNVDGGLLTTGLYGINLTTGQATLMGLGLGGLLWARRRQANRA